MAEEKKQSLAGDILSWLTTNTEYEVGGVKQTYYIKEGELVSPFDADGKSRTQLVIQGVKKTDEGFRTIAVRNTRNENNLILVYNGVEVLKGANWETVKKVIKETSINE